MRRTTSLGLLALGSWTFLACQEELPTTTGDDLIPVSATTVEVRLPFEAFARNLKVWGGYGRAYQLPQTVVANNYQGTLDARTVAALTQYPRAASVRDSTGSVRTDTLLTFLGGRLVALVDTLTSIHDGPVELAVGALQQKWHYGSVSWAAAVDSVGDNQPWTEPGAGPVVPVGTTLWDQELAADSIIFELDSAAVATWSDTLAAAQGLRLDAVTEGVRLNLRNVYLLLTTRPSINPDTLVELTVGSLFRTFVYQPAVAVPDDEIRVGGVPAFRTTFDLDLPTELNGPPELCAKVTCPLALTPESLVSASLVLRSRAPHPAFQPTDSIYLDVREVLAAERMPKSPLGSSMTGSIGVGLAPGYFGGEAGTEISVSLGPYIEALIREKRGEDIDVSSTVALLSAYEPLSLQFGSFGGPGDPDQPQLRLVLTVGGGVGIR